MVFLPRYISPEFSYSFKMYNFLYSISSNNIGSNLEMDFFVISRFGDEIRFCNK